MQTLPRAERVDIMLLLEGTFPYVRGGVSSWVNQMIQAFPEYHFGVVFLGSHPEDYSGIKYELPANLKHLEVHYLYPEYEKPQPRGSMGSPETLAAIKSLHAWFRRPTAGKLEHLADPEFIHASIDAFQSLHAPGSWEFITATYQQQCAGSSFLDYLWTLRSMHAPIARIASIAQGLIPAGCYHTISTGYAGFLGALLSNKWQRPLLLSEHGLYTKERRIDLLQHDLLTDDRRTLQRDPAQISYNRALWIRFFTTLGRICYRSADAIVALFEETRLQQIADGAAAERTRVIANGINTSRLAPLAARERAEPPAVVSLIGRIVPIKDIQTFIRAIRVLALQMPNIQGWIVGPDDEDPGYARECRGLVDSLGVAAQVRFLGFRDVAEILAETGIVVLSSISEGQPLVVLEAFAAGVPVVATDVGSCRQLVFGRGEEDQALGAAGAIVGINDSKALAAAVAGLLQSPPRWQAARQAGLARVERYYTLPSMIAAYRELYRKGVGRWRG
jgi:polysaccharide biosynthesis protein PelF